MTDGLPVDIHREFFFSLEKQQIFLHPNFSFHFYSGSIRSANKHKHREVAMEDKYHILLVEDDEEIRSGIEIYLKNQGYEVFKAGNGVEGLKILETETIHLAILDIMMPVMDGITMLLKLREKEYDFPCIMLTAKSEEVDKIMGLNMGADDYITKPFTPLELLARVNAHLRRYSRFMNKLTDSDNAKGDRILTVGGLELNQDTVEVFANGEPVRLTPIEFKILELLMKSPGRVFSSDEIYETVWNERAINTDTIMVHVRNIREKIEVDPKKPMYLKVVWGVGYKIEKQ
jgi:DNA-binding response OmpR family regulator